MSFNIKKHFNIFYLHATFQLQQLNLTIVDGVFQMALLRTDDPVESVAREPY